MLKVAFSLSSTDWRASTRLSPRFRALDAEIDCDPEQMLGDKGYDSEADSATTLEERGAKPVNPQHCNPENTAHRRQALSMPCAIASSAPSIVLKNSRRVATRYDKLMRELRRLRLLRLHPLYRGFSLSTRLALQL